MGKEYIKIRNEKPTTPFSKNRDVLKTMNEEFWKSWIFYYLLYFYENFDKIKLKQKIEIENITRVEKAISDSLSKYLKNNTEFDRDIGFKINREVQSESDKESYYDIKIEHSCWEKMFCFECKNLDGKLRLNKEYINNGVYRYFNGKYAPNQNFGGMIGYVLNGDCMTIKEKIQEKLRKKFDTSPDGDLKRMEKLDDNPFAFNSFHSRFGSEFVIHHLLFDFIQIN